MSVPSFFRSIIGSPLQEPRLHLFLLSRYTTNLVHRRIDLQCKVSLIQQESVETVLPSVTSNTSPNCSVSPNQGMFSTPGHKRLLTLESDINLGVVSSIELGQGGLAKHSRAVSEVSRETHLWTFLCDIQHCMMWVLLLIIPSQPQYYHINTQLSDTNACWKYNDYIRS